MDRTLVYEADELEGFVDFLTMNEEKTKTQGSISVRFWQLDRDPETGLILGPLLTRKTGRVEIRLKDTAPERVRFAYEALRRGTLEKEGKGWRVTDR